MASEVIESSDDLFKEDSVRPFEQLVDRGFRGLTRVMAIMVIVTLVGVVLEIGITALPALNHFGFSFLTTTSWDPTRGVFGILPDVWGTLYSSLLALVLGTLFGLAVAIFLSEDFIPRKWELLLGNIIDLLAAIPSVIYGLWGIFVVIPLLRPVANWASQSLDWLPFFNTGYSGPAMLPAALVLAIMILPTVTAISRQAIKAVPHRLREGAVGLGATKWETILKIVLPTASTGIAGGVILGFGRALGETMALAMLVGNTNTLTLSLLSPANTLASLLANHFPEAAGLEVGALMYASLVLLAITLLVNIIGSVIVWHATKNLKGLR